MKDKILKLVYKNLDEVDGSTKFYNFNKYEVIRPFTLSRFDVEKNEDYQYNWLGWYRGGAIQYWSPSGSYQKDENAYIDCHAWYFTPKSWTEIISELRSLDLIRFEIDFLQETQCNDLEFYSVLRKSR